MRKSSSKVEMLRSIPSLAAYNDRVLAEIAPLVDEESLESGTVLTVEGQPGKQAFLIVEGEAAVSVGGELLATVGPGQFVGEMSLLDHGPCSASVTAISPMRVLVMDPRSFVTLLDNASMARRVARSLAERLRTTEGSPTYT